MIHPPSMLNVMNLDVQYPRCQAADPGDWEAVNQLASDEEVKGANWKIKVYDPACD